VHDIINGVKKGIDIAVKVVPQICDIVQFFANLFGRRQLSADAAARLLKDESVERRAAADVVMQIGNVIQTLLPHVCNAFTLLMKLFSARLLSTETVEVIMV